MAEGIPILPRQAQLQTVAAPEVQSSADALAESQNNLSAIGAKVAQSASNQMASQLGYEQGKTPSGDLMPAITDFDKHFSETYASQANATLTIQGQKLLDDTQLQMSKAPRLSPDMIANAQDQLTKGLSKIAEQAPTDIKGQLQQQFDSHVLQQVTQYNERMIGENRDDSKSNLQNGIDLSIKNAYEAYSKGDMKGGDAATKAAIGMAGNGANNKFFTPEETRTYQETAKQNALNAQFIFQAQNAEKKGKLAEFERNFADKKLPGTESMTAEQHTAAGQAITAQMNFLQSMRAQDENLKAQNMLNAIAVNPSVAATQWPAFASSVSPAKAAEVQFHLIQAMKKTNATQVGVDSLLNNWSNPELHAQASEKVRNAAFLKQVDHTVSSGDQARTPISHEDAEVQVAATAGGKIPVFVNEIKNKLYSGNPAFIESAANQIHQLQALNAGHALDGLDDKDKALYTTYEAFKDSRDPATAARDASAAILNQDPAVEEQNKQKWSNYVSTATKGSGQPLTQWALSKFGMNQNTFQNPATAQVYGTDILNKYRNFYQLLNGDDNSAKKLTQQYIDQNYGETGVNGGSYKTLQPLEKTLGFQDSSGVPYIQQDVINQISPKLAAVKDLYDKGKSKEYWEVLPLTGKKHGIFSTTYDPIQLKQHVRSGNTAKTNIYNVVLQGNAFDNWDVAIQTDTGLRNLFQTAPFLGVVSYVPNAKAIRDRYNNDHKLK